MSEENLPVRAAPSAPSSLVRSAMTPEQVGLLKRTVAEGTSDDEFALFLAMAERAGLDPFQRQIYAVMRYSTQHRRKVMAIQTGIDGFRLIAERTGKYLGQTPPEWCGRDGAWRTVWTSSEFPFAARVGVFKRGNPNPTLRVALWSEFAQFAKNERGERYLSGKWETMPANQLLKCAEAQALRAAFPNVLSGIYTDEEMAQNDNPPPIMIGTPPLLEASASSAPASEPVPISWADLGADGSSSRIVGKITSVAERPNSTGRHLELTIVREDGDSSEYLTRRLDLMPIAEAAIAGAALVEVRYIPRGELRQLVSVRDPRLPIEEEATT